MIDPEAQAQKDELNHSEFVCHQRKEAFHIYHTFMVSILEPFSCCFFMQSQIFKCFSSAAQSAFICTVYEDAKHLHAYPTTGRNLLSEWNHISTWRSVRYANRGPSKKRDCWAGVARRWRWLSHADNSSMMNEWMNGQKKMCVCVCMNQTPMNGARCVSANQLCVVTMLWFWVVQSSQFLPSAFWTHTPQRNPPLQ